MNASDSTVFIAPVCNAGDPIPSIPDFQPATRSWAIGTDCLPHVLQLQPMPQSRSWLVQIGSDAKGQLQFAGFAKYSDGNTTIFINSHVFKVPVGVTALAFGVALELILILLVSCLLFHRRPR